MRKFSAILLMLYLVIGQVTFAQKSIKLKSASINKNRVTENKANSFRLTTKIAQLKFNKEKTDKGNFETLSIDGLSKTFNEGYPNLPVISKLIEIPIDAEVKVKIISYDEEIIKLKDYNISDKIMPSQASLEKSIDPSTVALKINKKVYRNNQYYKQKLVTIEDVGILRNKRFGYLQISPIQYNPVKNVIKVLNNIVVDIEFVVSNKLKSKVSNNQFYSPYFESIASKTINYISSTKELIKSEPVKYVIISDPMFEATLQPFIDWKIKKGFNVIVGYTNDASIGNTTTSIKAYLQDLYENSSDSIAPSFVLFVGDIAQIPAFDGTSGSHVSDLYYCEYTGDKLPEVFYGRFSAETTDELQHQIDKTLEVEKYEMPDPSYLDNVVLVAGVDAANAPTYGNGAINYANSNYTNAENGITSYSYLYKDNSGVMPSDSSAASASIISNISTGVSLANYTAHCSPNGWYDPSFSISDISGMNNEHMYPLLIGNCCLSSKFDDNDCFAEEIVYAQNEGAVAYIGGSNSTYWDEDYWWGVGLTSTITANPTYDGSELGAYDRAFHSHGEAESDWFVTASQMIVAGNLAVESSTSDRKTYYWEIYHLMGDPSLTPYITVPSAITASYNSKIIVGESSFTVNTEKNAYVALSKDGVLLDAKIADESGIVILSFPELTEVGVADIVITKQNRAPEISTVDIIPSTTPYVILDSYVINDAAANNNDLADFGEIVNLDVTLKNVSESYDSYNLETELAVTDTNIIITDSIETFGDIDANADSTIATAYAISINNDIEDQKVINFELAVTGDDSESNSYTWNSNFNITVNAPVLEIGEMIIDDASGNRDGILDPGETATVNISTTNSGHADITNVIGSLTIADGSSQYLTINDGTSDTYSLVTNDTVIASFTVTADINTPIETLVNLNVNLSGGINNQYSDTIGEVIVIGEIPRYTINQEGTVSSCMGFFYDSGSSSANYSDNEDYIMTFTSPDLGKNIKINFLNFDVEAEASCNFDKLSIYNGTSVSDRLIGEYCGTSSPGVVLASNPDGALTFKFHSDVSETRPGWEAEMSCVEAYEVKFVVSSDSGFIAGATVNFNGEERVTDTNGECLFTNINTQNGVSYTIIKSGYFDVTSSLDVINQNLIENITLEVANYDVTFNIKDGKSNAFEGVNVLFNSKEQVTNSDGSTTFMNIIPGKNLDYRITKDGFNDKTGSIDVVDNDVSINISLTSTVGFESLSDLSISIYPNPTNDKFFIEGNNIINANIEIRNISGMLIVSRKIRNTKTMIDLSSEAKGIYFIKIYNNSKQVVGKIIVK